MLWCEQADIFNVKDLRILLVVNGVDVTDSVQNDSTSLFEDIDFIENASKIYIENKKDLIPGSHGINKGKKGQKIQSRKGWLIEC